MATKPQKVTQYRSAIDGRFVAKPYADTHPHTTVKERNLKPTPTKSK
jgi:hypothetical protein